VLEPAPTQPDDEESEDDAVGAPVAAAVGLANEDGAAAAHEAFAPPPPLPAPAGQAAASALAAPRARAAPVRPLEDYRSDCWSVLDTVALTEEFALDCPTLRSIPRSARSVVADTTLELCNAALRAPPGSRAEERAWKLLLLRERLLFAAPLQLSAQRRGARRRDTEGERLDLGRLVRERCGALLRGDWEDLLAERRASARTLARHREKHATDSRDESYLADEVVRKTLAEEYSRAAALLQSPGLAPLTRETAGALQALLQPRDKPALAPRAAVPGGVRAELFSRSDAKQALRRTPRGSGAALGGGRWEHWRCVLSSSTAVTAFYEVLLRVASARLPASAADALALSKLTPLRKAGGGVRPIAAPSLLRRLAGRLLASTRKKELAEALGPRQFAIGTAAGTEVLAHTVRALTEADPSLVLTALDARNAYCMASREACLTQLGTAAPQLLPFAELFCRRESRYFFWDGAGQCHTLCATSGVDQGDPLAPLLFACGLRPGLRGLEDALRDAATARGLARESVRVFAYLDDLAVLTPPGLAADVLPTAQRVLDAFELELNAAKTQVWSRASPRPTGVPEEHWRAAGLTLVGVPLGEPLPANGLPDHEDEVRVDLGAASFTAERCAETAARAAAFVGKLAELPELASPHLPAVQSAALLLRLCGLGKLTHLLRSNAPPQTQGAARDFDTAVLHAYETLAALDPLTSEQALQCQLPLRLGGRGLRSQERLAPAAWVGSWAQCVAEVALRTGLDSLLDLDSSPLPLAAACREALAALPPAPPGARQEETLPSWSDLARAPRAKAQRLLSKRLDEKNYNQLLSVLCEPEAARLRSCGGPLAGGWQLATPGQRAELLEDRDYEATARALLGQDLANPDGATCRNRRRTGARAGEACGAPLCRKARHSYLCAVGGGFVSRTEAVERVWGRIHAECGYAVDTQVYEPSWDRWRWRCPTPGCAGHGVVWQLPAAPCSLCGARVPVEREEAVLDLEVRSAEVPKKFLDVTVRHPVSNVAGRLSRAARADGATNAVAEGDKRDRYPSERSVHAVVPLALETYGRHGKTALRYLRKLARKQAETLEDSSGETASALVVRWGRWLSVALHRATARNLRASAGDEAARRARGQRLAEELAG
jgi:hypothetical protein